MVERVKREKTVDASSVFSKGCLVHLKIRCWGARSKLDENFFSEQMPVEIVRAVYDLLTDKTYLRQLHEMRSEAKRFVARYSLPFPVDGLVFILKQNITIVDEGLRRRREEFLSKVEQFLSGYEADKRDFQKKYPHLYRPEKYPSQDVMRRIFRFEWYFRHFVAPDRSLEVLPPEVYEEEVRKIQAEARRMRDVAISTIAQKFLSKIESLKEQCSRDKINTATVNSLKQFLDDFSSSWDGFLGYQKLSSLVEECKDALDGIGAEELRYDDDFRSLIGKKMESIIGDFSKIADVRLRRKIDF